MQPRIQQNTTQLKRTEQFCPKIVFSHFGNIFDYSGTESDVTFMRSENSPNKIKQPPFFHSFVMSFIALERAQIKLETLI